MNRDLRLTGDLRGQTDKHEAPPGFELNNPWRVRRTLTLLLWEWMLTFLIAGITDTLELACYFSIQQIVPLSPGIYSESSQCEQRLYSTSIIQRKGLSAPPSCSRSRQLRHFSSNTFNLLLPQMHTKPFLQCCNPLTFRRQCFPFFCNPVHSFLHFVIKKDNQPYDFVPGFVHDHLRADDPETKPQFRVTAGVKIHHFEVFLGEF